MARRKTDPLLPDPSDVVTVPDPATAADPPPAAPEDTVRAGIPRRKPSRAPRHVRPGGGDVGEAVQLPVIPLRDMVIFPHMVTQFFVGRDISLAAVAAATAADGRILAVAQREPETEDVTPADLYPVGVEVAIGRVLKMPDGTTALLVQGQRRIAVTGYSQTTPFLCAEGHVVPEPTTRQLPTEALMRAVLALFERVVKMSRTLPEDAYVAALNVEEPGWLADLIASSVQFDLAGRQDILSTRDPAERLQKLSVMLAKEVDVLDLESRIQTEVQKEVDKSQREYYLREQLKAIQHELGEDDPQTRETNELRTKIEAAGMPEEVHKKAVEELDRLALMPSMAPEVGIIRTYLDWLVTLPWTVQTTDHLNIKDAERMLAANHYGLPKVKERILEYMAVRRLAQGHMRQPILCFVGPPGVGKTSLGRSIAQALGRKFVRVSLGGIRDEAEIRGHRRTYIGALPGRILQTMRTAGTVNPVFMLDEIDKMGADFRGDPAAAMLEVLDPEQNYSFSDHYLDVPYNLSKVLFIMTANLLDPVPDALLDRMEVIELPGYIEEEKFHIARNFLVPRQVTEHGLLLPQVQFADSALYTIIREYTHEAGVRNLEREIGAVCRKLARKVVEGLPDDLSPDPSPTKGGEIAGAVVADLSPDPSPEGGGEIVGAVVADRFADLAPGGELAPPSSVGKGAGGLGQANGHGPGPAVNGHGPELGPIATDDPDPSAIRNPQSAIRNPAQRFVIRDRQVAGYLGPPRYSWGVAECEDEVGLATGVSWTPMGGDTMGIEVTLMAGRGNLLLTGQLGDVMKESAQAGLSYARSWATRYGIDPARFEKLDIHVHVPAGAIPKDGPSAGVTMTTAMISALTRRPVRRDVAMTGEITLRGKVLPIGGLKDKVLAAHRAGIRTIILPRKNEKDLVEIPAHVRRQLTFVPVDDMSGVLDAALLPDPVREADPELGAPPPEATASTA
ncbi:MAG: endopeptidase La [Chloroflexota bacterium]|nr:endopeptidase La [Chloroflexota bacterium]